MGEGLDDLPISDELTPSGQEGQGSDHRSPEGAQTHFQEGGHRHCAQTTLRGWNQTRAGRRLPARVLRRYEAESDHSSSSCPLTKTSHRRRANLSAGRGNSAPDPLAAEEEG